MNKNRFVSDKSDLVIENPKNMLNDFESDLSDMEAISQVTDLQLRTYLKEQISMKQFITNELKKSDIAIDYEMQLKNALQMIDNNIQRIRVEGIL